MTAFLALLGLACAIVIASEAVIFAILFVYATTPPPPSPITTPKPTPAREAQYDPAFHLAQSRRAFK